MTDATREALARAETAERKLAELTRP